MFNAEIVMLEFLDALLARPVPTVVFNVLIKFLDLQSSITGLPEFLSPKNCHLDDKDFDSSLGQEMSEVLHHCGTELEKSEKQIRSARNLLPILHDRPLMSNDESRILPRITSPGTNQMIFDKLKSVMIERDTMHSSLVASRVYHAHEIEMERKKNKRLEARIKSIEEMSDRTSAPGAVFFLGQPTIPDINSLRKSERDMIQDVEMELNSLCCQLASAISSRVSAELEIERIMEIQATKEAIHNQEMSKLKEELLLVKKQAHEETMKRIKAEKECQKWRDSFEALLSSSS
jgi:hypothetical protein